MLFCNHLILHICMYLDINTLFMFLLYSHLLIETKNIIVKKYCIIHKLINDLDIQNYYNTLIYFQNKQIYNCFKCNKPIKKKYFLVICSCITDSMNKNVVYTKYHINCIPDKEEKSNKLVNTINCEFCKKKRIYFHCNIYS